MTNKCDLILQDLQEESICNILPIRIHDDAEDFKVQIKFLVKQLRRAKSMNNRKEVLLNAWYIGEIIETKTTTLLERTTCMKLLTPYYQKVVIRLYYIFEFLGVEQIYRSKNTTLTMISKLNMTEYLALQQEARTIAGARLSEEEVVNLEIF
jgi:hypothetical protein